MDAEKVMNMIKNSRAGVHFTEYIADDSVIFETYRRPNMKGVGLLYSEENKAALKIKKDRILLHFRGDLCSTAEEAANKSHSKYKQNIKMPNGMFLAPQRSGAWLVEHCNSYDEANVEIAFNEDHAYLRQIKTLNPGDVLRYPYGEPNSVIYKQLQKEIKQQNEYQQLEQKAKKQRVKYKNMSEKHGYLHNNNKRFVSIGGMMKNSTKFTSKRQPKKNGATL